MRNVRMRPYSRAVERMMGEKSQILSKAQTFSDMGMAETAQPLWASAGAYEEQIAPLLEALGRDMEAAVHRISAASCYARAGDPSRAANLYRAALSGPLRDETRREVELMLAECLSELGGSRGRAAMARGAAPAA